MNYAELQTAILEDTHREDLASLVPRFIREAEGMIRRDLTAYLITTTLTETDRVLANASQYMLPGDSLVIRRVALQGQIGPGITRIALDSITSYVDSNRVAVYVEAGDGTIEFRGVPPENAVFDLNYFGMPAPLVNPTDTNSLLTENESLYKSASMFFLYQNTQDRELANDSAQLFDGIIETLNEQIARKIGGAKITASYQFGNGGSY